MKVIEIPEGYEARLDGNKVILERKESEDERIRKWLSDNLDTANWRNDWPYTKQQVINYLEKQKEQKSLSTEETELNSIAFLEQMGYTCIPPGAEQKPEVKCVYPKFRVGEEIVEVTPNGYCPPVVVKYIREGAYRCESKDGKRFLSFPIENENKYRLIEQKPAEWSEEDTLMLTAIIQTLERFGGRGTTGMQIDWLEHLRPPFKPSEEQMEALSWAINYLTDIEQGCASTLALLKFNLKELL